MSLTNMASSQKLDDDFEHFVKISDGDKFFLLKGESKSFRRQIGSFRESPQVTQLGQGGSPHHHQVRFDITEGSGPVVSYSGESV